MSLLDRMKARWQPAPAIPPKTIAIVIPWFGEDLKGGAEQQAWQIATRLAARGHSVEVLTTCCRSFMDDWSQNHQPAGLSLPANSLCIRRFPVNRRDTGAFDQLNGQLLALPRTALHPGVCPVTMDEAERFARHNITSSALLDYLRTDGGAYHAFLFIPYLYGPILNGLPLVADRAFLQPCLHDEVYAYLPTVATIFHQTRHLLFNSAGEQALAARLYGPGMLAKSIVVGEGIEFADIDTPQPRYLPAELRDRPFILCLGRRDATKNTDLLVTAYTRFREQHPDSRLYLVLAGPGHASYTGRALGLLDLGLVDAPVKAALLQHCQALAQPSVNESFSRVMFEAWHCGKPVAVHRECLATALAVMDAEGGWAIGNLEEWCAWLARIEQMDPAELTDLGQRGQAYARDQADWEPVMVRYEQLLFPSTAHRPRISSPFAVHQLLPNLSYGDAISNHALAIRDRLRDQGYQSDIFIRHVDPRLADQCQLYRDGAIPATARLIYHHSIGSEITPAAIAHSGPKCLIYHNITPAEFFAPYRPDFAELLRQGRRDMFGLASTFPLSVGDSAFNASELEAFGFHDPGVLPIAINPAKWDFPADEPLMRQLQDGRTNLLFVGRISPNKRQNQLIEAFACYRHFDPNARLILVGSGELPDPYVRQVYDTRSRLGLEEQVMISGHVNDAQLAAYYRTAHLFWSMSEHEGFCVPLIEAMWFDVPILAYKSSAIAETLATAGLLFTTKDRLVEMAAAAKLMVHDADLRHAVLKAQRRRRQDFLPERVWPALDQMVSALHATAPDRIATALHATLPSRAVCSPATTRPRIAFVVQRCGLEVNGGAEQLCLQIARRMSAHWDTEILTTCALDYVTWANHYPATPETVDGVLIRRFPVAVTRDITHFNRLSEQLHPHRATASLAEQEAWMHAQGPWAPELFAWIEQQQEIYDAFIFFGYLYATTYFGLPLAGNKALLAPLAHDEWPIYLPMWDRLFTLPRGFIFNTPEERDFVRQRFPALTLGGPVAGVAVDAHPNEDGARFRQRYAINAPFLLYMGRIEPSKGCDELFAHFIELRRHEQQPRKLVLLGRAVMDIPAHPDILPIGFVDEQTKWDALAACELLVMPSPYESLSMVLLEAWSTRKPVLVNGQCAVLVGQCRRANGGLWYKNFAEFAVCLHTLQDDALRACLGAQGQRFVEQNYTWPRIEEHYLDVLRCLNQTAGSSG